MRHRDIDMDIDIDVDIDINVDIDIDTDVFLNSQDRREAGTTFKSITLSW